MIELTERQARIVADGIRSYLDPYNEYRKDRPKITTPTITNDRWMIIIECIMDAFKEANHHTIGELNMMYSLTATECRELVDATVNFMNTEGTGTAVEELRDAGFNIRKREAADV